MISLETQYFKLNRLLLLIIGLWPLQQSNLSRLQFIFCSSILITSIIFQLMAFITLKCTPDHITKVLSSTCFSSTFVIKYILFHFNIKAMKDLLMQLQNIFDGLKDKNEIAIMRKYSCNAKRYTIILAVLGGCTIFSAIIALFWSRILHIILPMNVSRRLPIRLEYFIDQEKYFYWILLHISIALFIGPIAMVAIGTMLIAYIQYTCGMFRISSYRIRRAVHVNTSEEVKSNKENLILKGIISAVNIHRQAMKLTGLLLSNIQTMLFCLIIIGVISLSLNLFQEILFAYILDCQLLRLRTIFCLQLLLPTFPIAYMYYCTHEKHKEIKIVSSGNDVKEFIFPFVFVNVSILYMFLANYMAQNLMDHNNDIFTTVYDVKWHAAPLHIQKVILFLLQRGTKDLTLSVGGLFVGSLECFATLVKTSVSYFTVIYSTQ